MRKNTIYKARFNSYDINDDDFYVFKITSDMKYNEIDESSYYDSILLIYRGGTCEYAISFYPNDWSYIEELSSLEEALL